MNESANGMDALDRIGAEAFPGYLVRKDLVRRYAQQFPVPTYVVEFLLGRFCASTDETEIQEGLQIVESQLRGRTVRASDREKFRSDAREKGSVRLIDLVRARLDARRDCYLVELPSLGERRVGIEAKTVLDNPRMLTDGFYAEVTLRYDALAAQESHAEPFRIEALRPIQMSDPEVLDRLGAGRRRFTTAEWRDFLIRSVGLEPTALDERSKGVALLRMAPFVEPNFNLVELGPRGTGKSHLYQQISPYSHLISGGKATVAKMFVNMANGQRGLVCSYDVVCFDEVSGVSFDQKDGVNIMKGYMASGEFSRGKESIRARGGIVMVGNFDVDLEATAAARTPVEPAADGDARRHRVPRPHPRLRPRLGLPQAEPGEAPHEPVRTGQRLPERVLDEDAGHTACLRAAQPSLLGRRAERARSGGGQQDLFRAGEAAVPRREDGDPRRRPRRDRPAGAGSPAQSEGAAETLSQE